MKCPGQFVHANNSVEGREEKEGNRKIVFRTFTKVSFELPFQERQCFS